MAKPASQRADLPDRDGRDAFAKVEASLASYRTGGRLLRERVPPLDEGILALPALRAAAARTLAATATCAGVAARDAEQGTHTAAEEYARHAAEMAAWAAKALRLIQRLQDACDREGVTRQGAQRRRDEATEADRHADDLADGAAADADPMEA